MGIVRATVLFGLLLLVSACGGGGGGGGGASLDVTPSSVTFRGTVGGPPPDAQVVNATFGGDAVVVGYAPGVTVPNWLSISQAGQDGKSANFLFGVFDTNAPGTRSTSVRFATGRRTRDGDVTDVTTRDISVSYTLTESNLAISAAPTSLSFQAPASDPLPAAKTVSATFNGAIVSVISAPAWLEASVTTASSVSPATITARPNSTDFAEGTFLTGELVIGTSRPPDPFARTVSIPVQYTVQASNLAISAAPAAMAFDADFNGALPVAKSFTVTFNGAAAVIDSAPSYLTITPRGSTAISPVTFDVVPNTTSGAGLMEGTTTAAVVVSTLRPGGSLRRSANVLVSYTLTPPFEVQAASPMSFSGIRGEVHDPRTGPPPN